MVYATDNSRSASASASASTSADVDSNSLIDLEMGCQRTPTKTHNLTCSVSSPNLKSQESPGADLDPDGSGKKKKRPKKAPKPPRPPRPVPLDLSDQKLVNELTEIAMLKKARIERMKALKKLKNSKPTSASATGSCCALLITLIFCLVIFWHGMFSISRGSGGIMGFHGSPESSFVSVQTYRNASPTISPRGFTTSSPKNVEPETGLEMHGENSRVVG